jgi:gamma-aminobutyric acid type B receptor
VSTFFQEINNPPIKVGWVGSGCSLATEPTAELTQFYNITQLSCISSSPELKDRRRFRYYFQLVATEVLIAQGFYGIIKKFGWKRVGVIVQDENLFTASLDALKQELTGDGVNCTEKRFRSDEGISGLGAEIFEPGIRVYVLMMYSPHARDILCEAYKSGLRYPKHMIITYGWYANNWWMEPATSDQYNCTAYERASVLLYTLAPVIREYPVNFSAQAEPDNITAAEFGTRYFDAVDEDINQKINLTSFLDGNEEPYVYSYHCHEATIAFAYALNKTIEDLIKNDTVNSKAAKESGLPEGANFTMADFTYANSVVVSRMFTHLQNTSFPGISGNEVRFNKEGTRDVNAVAILQYQPLNGVLVREHELVREQVALVIYSDGNNTFFQDNTLMLPGNKR